MMITNSGINYNIIEGNTKFLPQLPPKVYSVHFSKMCGYWLSERKEISVGNFKVYGNTPSRVEKIFKTFGLRERNFGVLLSGEKGMGKSVFMRYLSEESVRRGFPVIVVDENLPGIGKFISTIDQECVVLFDEFEKIFPGGTGDPGCVATGDDESGSQVQFLQLFDGIDSGKKMFVIAINKRYNISDYFINRPGRFYYHFHFNYLSEDEVREYCIDNLKKGGSDAIDKICVIAKYHNLNYDMLSAIVTELNNGFEMKETLNDLNIDIDETSKFYNFSIEVGGIRLTGSKWLSDRTEHDDMYVNLSKNGGYTDACVYFSLGNMDYDTKNGCLKIPKLKIKKIVAERPFGKFTVDDLNEPISLENYGDLEIRPSELPQSANLDYLFD